MPGSVAQPLILAALHSAARQQGRQIGQKPRQPAPRVNRRGRVSALSAASALQCSAPIQINSDDAAALIPDYQLGEEVSPPPPRTCQRLTKLCVSPAHARLSWLNVDDTFDVYTARPSPAALPSSRDCPCVCWTSPASSAWLHGLKCVLLACFLCLRLLSVRVRWHWSHFHADWARQLCSGSALHLSRRQQPVCG